MKRLQALRPAWLIIGPFPRHHTGEAHNGVDLADRMAIASAMALGIGDARHVDLRSR